MIYLVKERLDIQVQNPVVPPTALSRLSERIMCRFVRSVSVGVLMEHRFQFGLQHHDRHHLGYPVGDRRYPQRTNTAVRLWNVHPTDRFGVVAAGRHPIPDLIEIVPQVRLEFRQRLPINPRSALIRSHTLPGLPNLTLGDWKRLRLLH